MKEKKRQKLLEKRLCKAIKVYGELFIKPMFERRGIWKEFVKIKKDL